MLVFLRSTKTGPFLDSRTPTIIDEFRMFPSNALVFGSIDLFFIFGDFITQNKPKYTKIC